MTRQQIELQKAFYLHLLSLDNRTEIDDHLKQALRLLVAITRADEGYIEMIDLSGNTIFSSISFSDEEVRNIQSVISTGVIRETLEKQKIVQTSSAITDPRFRERVSVQDARIKGVLCVPVKTGRGKGVVYLQGDHIHDRESEALLDDVLLFTRHISSVLDQLLINRMNTAACDYTEELRKQYQLEKIIGRSEALAKILKAALMVAPLKVNVLLTGKSGTGKTQMAEIIHRNSFQAENPFVELNCAAIPESLMENELFGSVAGAHSTATRAMPGKVAAAEGGTLFLDEISELSSSAQAKLLQLLESGVYYPLGSSKPSSADVRVITASNIDLEKAVIDGRFREDLYYRIRIFAIHMPELSERGDDVVELISYFCREISQKHGLAEKSVSAPAMAFLISRHWDGNIRELRHTLESAVIHASLEDRNEIVKKDLQAGNSENTGPQMTDISFKEATLQFQKEFIKLKLDENNWNISQTAKALEMSRSQLNNLIRQFNLSRQTHHPET